MSDEKKDKDEKLEINKGIIQPGKTITFSFNNKEKESMCGICKWFECYDDGDGYYDMWCESPNVNVSNWGENTFLYKDVRHCPFFEEED